MKRSTSSSTPSAGCKNEQRSKRCLAGFGFLALLVGFVALHYHLRRNLNKDPPARVRHSNAIPLLGKSKERNQNNDSSAQEDTATVAQVPPPSLQDWCMPNGAFDIFGTYRAPHDQAEGGLLFAPGHFQATALAAQNDDTAWFHMTNLRYGNMASDKHTTDISQFDAYCIFRTRGESACHVPHFFPDGHKHGRCVKVTLPSIQGNARCRQMAMANFQFMGATTLGENVVTEKWSARLDEDSGNDYEGQLTLFMQTAGEKLKIPLTHWLTSDDQKLEASFQVSNWREWDPAGYPEVPEGCETAIELSDVKDHLKWNLNKCPFGAIHRHLLQQAWMNHN